jgi:hypothetical protein
MFTPVMMKSAVQLGAAFTSNEYFAGMAMVPPLPLFIE